GGKSDNLYGDIKQPGSNGVSNSYVQVLKGQSQSGMPPEVLLVSPLRDSSMLALVLDDSCLVSNDLDNFVMGEVRQFSSINNLHVLLSNEGFPNVQLAYLGGLWVMIKLQSTKAKLKFMKHMGVASWFSHLCNAQQDFIANERIVWVDIEGLPLHAWSHTTFLKIGSKWGEVMEVDDVKGKVFRVRAKELFVWSPSFIDAPEVVHYSDDEFVKGDVENVVETSKFNNVEVESDSEVVSDTFFGDNADEKECVNDEGQSPNVKEGSADPFNIYELLNKRDKDVGKSEDAEFVRSQSKSEGCNSRIFEGVVNSNLNCSSEGRDKGISRKDGGSILEVLDEMIKVGQAMGFVMDGCTRDMENIIGSQGAHEFPR
ncbi:RNA-directed DNA polymerase, eukaryota, partial [Tanacetum coccineum]